jgi:hypothetical protein
LSIGQVDVGHLKGRRFHRSLAERLNNGIETNIRVGTPVGQVVDEDTTSGGNDIGDEYLYKKAFGHRSSPM